MIIDFILNNATNEQLGLAVQENLFALFRAMAALPDGQLEEKEYSSRHLTYPINPMYKGVWKSRIPLDHADEHIRETVGWFKSRETPFFFWWTGPGTAPDDLAGRLLAQGFLDLEGQVTSTLQGIKSSEVGAPGMAADLHKMNENVLDKISSELEISDVQNEKDLQDFKQVLVEGYQMSAAVADSWVQSAHEFGIGKTPWRLVLGRLKGQPVATNIVMYGGGVAGVYAIAVLPSERGKGIGTAITLKPILEARDQDGYNYAVLFASPLGSSVYAKIGFQMMDVKINRYLWVNT